MSKRRNIDSINFEKLRFHRQILLRFDGRNRSSLPHIQKYCLYQPKQRVNVIFLSCAIPRTAVILCMSFSTTTIISSFSFNRTTTHSFNVHHNNEALTHCRPCIVVIRIHTAHTIQYCFAFDQSATTTSVLEIVFPSQ